MLTMILQFSLRHVGPDSKLGLIGVLTPEASRAEEFD
jgi:hypothetical protein